MLNYCEDGNKHTYAESVYCRGGAQVFNTSKSGSTDCNLGRVQGTLQAPIKANSLHIFLDFSGPYGPMSVHMGPNGPIWARPGPLKSGKSSKKTNKHFFK